MTLKGNEHNGHEETPGGALTGHVDNWEEAAVDYLDGVLDAPTAAALEAHLRECPACSARLRTQTRLISFLEDIDYEAPPAGLEDRVLGELLSPTASLADTGTQPVQNEPSGWSLLWRRKIVPWMPATVGVVAVLAAIVTYGLVSQSNDESLDMANLTTVVQADTTKVIEAPGSATPASEESARSSDTTTAPATTAVMLGVETTATPTTESADTTTAVAVAADATVTVQDKGTMIADLESAGSPAYFVFETETIEDGSGEGGGETDTAIAQQLTTLTGLAPVDQSLWIEGPTFAAYLPREDAKQLVELLFSIGASFETSLGMAWQPLEILVDTSSETSSSETRARASRLMERKTEFPELSAQRTAQPAVAGWSFTTSTLKPMTAVSDVMPPQELPDEAGTHVLIVIYLRN